MVAVITNEPAPARMPARLPATAMYHLAGAMPLASRSAAGPTLYALTIIGAKDGCHGGATLAGPAVTEAGLTQGWPSIAREAARALFARPFRRAGGVTVIVIMQVGRASHCVLVNLPAMSASATSCAMVAGPIA
jgi:hypothetical protein